MNIWIHVPSPAAYLSLKCVWVVLFHYIQIGSKLVFSSSYKTSPEIKPYNRLPTNIQYTMYFVYLQSNTLLVYLMYRVSKKYEKIPQQIVLPKTGQFSATNPNPKYSSSSISKWNIEVILAPKIRRSVYVTLNTYLILGSWIMQLLTCQFFTIIL